MTLPPSVAWVFEAFAFAFGAVIGSFLNVVIGRVPAGESIVTPGSHCPKCGHAIRWYDNVPVVSWLVLRARCRDCHAPISARYPMVELLVALVALAIERRYGITWATPAFFTFAALMIAIAYIDLDTWHIPYALSVPALVLGLAYSPLNPRFGHHWWLSPLGAAVGAAGFALVALAGRLALGKEALGLGDVILLAIAGAWLGPGGLLPVVTFSSLLGVIVGVAMLSTRKPAPEDTAPPAGAEPLAAPAIEPASDGRSEPGATSATPSPSVSDGRSEPGVMSATPSPSVSDGRSEPGVMSATDSPSVSDGRSEPGVMSPPADGGGEVPDPDNESWEPDPHAIQFGPFLVVAMLVELLLGDALAAYWQDVLRRLWS